MSIGAKIRKLRNKRALTQRELAREAGINRRTLARLEAETMGDPQLATIYKIAAALECTVSIELVEES